MKITVCYVTHRRAPRWEWFVDSLFRQTTAEQRADLQLVFVDGHAWDSEACAKVSAERHAEIPFCSLRRFSGTDATRKVGELALPFMNRARFEELERVVNSRFQYLHVPPKPCAWQGPFRQTQKDWFCAGNTRNTAFIVARHPYVVFCDDLSVLGPQWFNQVLHAAQDQYVMCGAYRKTRDLVVDDGLIVSFIPHLNEEGKDIGLDSRWDRGSDGGIVDWHGSALFGCSFGVALEAALEVDGNDAACNGQGAEDTDFGIRLERAGWSFKYNRNALTIESEELHHDGSKLPQGRKIVTPDRLPNNYDSYWHANGAEKYWSDHVMLNRLANETDRILPLIGDDLRTLRERYQATGCVPLPVPNQLDWRDGQPLSEQ